MVTDGEVEEAGSVSVGGEIHLKKVPNAKPSGGAAVRLKAGLGITAMDGALAVCHLVFQLLEILDRSISVLLDRV